MHSPTPSDVKLGMEMAKVLLQEDLESDFRRNVRYCVAVALFKSKSYVAARRDLNSILQVCQELGCGL